MPSRYIFDQHPDPKPLFDELHECNARDYKGLALGDVARHAARRFAARYALMSLRQMLVVLKRMPPSASFRGTGAADQNKQVSGDFQAARVISQELRVGWPGTAVDRAPLLSVFECFSLSQALEAFLHSALLGGACVKPRRK